MPLNAPTLTPILVANLLATGNLGQSIPQYAQGVANGVCLHLTSRAKVLTVDTGILGVGTGVAPFLLPQPLLLTSLLTGFTAGRMLGILAPLLATGLANGLAMGFVSLGLVRTNHPGVGTGAGVARLQTSSSVQSMIDGFRQAGMRGDGPEKKARAIGYGLDIAFAGFLMPITIVGSVSTSGGAGIGSGSIV